MPTKTFPVAASELTTSWLTEALGFEVTAFETQPLGEGVGILGDLSRLIISAYEGPATIIAKFPSRVRENREVAQQYDNYGREIRFYSSLADSIPLRTPYCYFSAIDESTHDFALLLEDLGQHRLGDQVEGCTESETRQVIDTLITLHGSTWQPGPDTGLKVHNTPNQVEGMIAGFKMGWPVIVDQFDELIPDSARIAGDAMPGAIESLMSQFCREPLSIVHGDVRLDNMFFTASGVLLVDWQSICLSAPEHDLAYFLTQSVPKNIRDATDWIAYYHKGIIDRGIHYSIDTCRERYKVCALYLLCYAVIIAGVLDLGNDRGRALAKTLLAGSMTELDSINAFDLLK